MLTARLTLVAVARVSALRETGVIIAAVIAALFFKEPFGIRRIMCAVMICIGIVLIKTAGAQ